MLRLASMKSTYKVLNCLPTVSSKNDCVIVVLNSAVYLSDQVGKAQARAIELGVPLAAIYCHNPSKVRYTNQVKDKLEGLEAGLAQFRIPFILVIGDSRLKIAGALRHFRPLEVFWADNAGIGAELIKHPYVWPGEILTVAQLENFLLKPETLTC